MHTSTSLSGVEAELKESENMLKELLFFINIKNTDHQHQIEDSHVSSSLIKFLSLIFLFCSKKKKKKKKKYQSCTKNSFSTFFLEVTLLRSSMNVYK